MSHARGSVHLCKNSSFKSFKIYFCTFNNNVMKFLTPKMLNVFLWCLLIVKMINYNLHQKHQTIYFYFCDLFRKIYSVPIELRIMTVIFIPTMNISMSNKVAVSIASVFIETNIHLLHLRVKETTSRGYARNCNSSFAVCY